MDFSELIAPSLELPEERPVDSQDYEAFTKNCDRILETKTIDDLVANDVIAAVLFVSENSCLKSVEYEEEKMVWSSPAQASFAQKVKRKIEELESVPFNEIIDTNIKELLQQLEPKLRKWTENPAACHAAVFLILNLPKEKCIQIFGQMLPHILRWLDSWMVRPRLLAVVVLDYLLDLPSSSFTPFGRDKVIYDALVKCVNSQDLCIIQAASSPITKVVKMITYNQDKSSLSHIDYFIDKLFTSLDMESKADKKLAKLQLLNSTWNLLEDAALRWIPRLADLVSGELSVVNDGTKPVLELWRLECRKHAAAAKLEARVILPALIKVIWKQCYDYISEDDICSSHLINTLALQISLDQKLFLTYTDGMHKCTQNTKFLAALETAYNMSHKLQCDSSLTEKT